MPIIYNPPASPLDDLNLTPNRVVITDGNGGFTTSPVVTPTELDALDGVDTRIDTRIDDVDTRIGDVDTRIGDVDTRIGDVESDLDNRFGNINSYETYNLIVPSGAYWSVAEIQLDEFDITVNSQPNINSEFGIEIVNNAGRCYIVSSHSGIESVNSTEIALPQTRAMRTNIQPDTRLVLFDDVDLSSPSSFLEAKLILSSYGNSSVYSSTLMIELNITRHDSSNKLFVIKAYTI